MCEFLKTLKTLDSMHRESFIMANSQDFSQKLVLVLTVAYFFMELFGGLYYHSIALTTDASFMAINITGQLIALYVERLTRRSPNNSKTFGYERAKVLSGLFNGILVGFIIFYVFIEAYGKVKHPEPLEADPILLIALVGLFVNAFGLFELYQHSKNINIKGAFLLILNDTLGSVGVILSALIIKYTGLYFVDPIAGMIVGLLAAYPTYFLLKNSLHILMEGNAPNISIEEVKSFIFGNFEDVSHVKDIHVWALSPDMIMLVLRIRTHESIEYRNTLRSMKELLKEKFDFFDIYIEGYERKTPRSHSTGQANGGGCKVVYE